MPMILQNTLPDAQKAPVTLPGTRPCAADDWLRIDEAYGQQMAYRATLLATKRKTVLHDSTAAPCHEVLETALGLLPSLGFTIAAGHVTCPDGRRVVIDRAAPLHTLGHLVQEDICVLEKRGREHVLTAAVLCFPANWRLADKINRPLTDIHGPVAEYDDTIARRVQRLFDGVRVGQPLWRFNRLHYAAAELHQPGGRATQGPMPFVRSERQCILRLAQSRAVVFTIHTSVVQTAALPAKP